jgi:hypothetical protein
MMTPLRKLLPGILRLCLGFVALAPLESAGESLRFRPVRTKNVDEPGRAPYQVSGLFVPSDCSFNGALYSCSLTLPVVPAGKRLVIEHLSMFVAVDGGSPDALRFLATPSGTAFFVQPTFTPRASNANHFFLDRPVLVYQEPGTIPGVLLTLTGLPSTAQLTVHGYLIGATN